MKSFLLLLCVFTIAAFASKSNLVVHEWGTYTSMQGPDGIPMPGLHHGEEKLPEFVHSRASDPKKRGINPPPLPSDSTPKDCYFCEVMDWKPVANSPFEVTQKLETPVIYFYADRDSAIDVNVSVYFPSGIVTETYPRPTINLPPIGQVKQTGNGYSEWHVTLHPTGKTVSIPSVDTNNIWAPSRRVNSLYLHNDFQEQEKLIFYRGLGRFNGPVAVKSDADQMTVENLSEQPIPAAWVLESDGKTSGTIKVLGPIPQRSRVSSHLTSGRVMEESRKMSLDCYVDQAANLIAAELVKSGLFPDEARAMVDTWRNSYFRTAGVRVLYIAPKTYPDRLLPLTVEPKPRAVSRVLVGRVEVLLKSEEKQLAEATQQVVVNNNKDAKEHVDYIKSLGRFAEAKIRYILANKKGVEQQQEQEHEQWILDNLTYDS